MRGSKLFLFLEGLICIAILPRLFTGCVGGELSESESFFKFISAVDSQNVLRIGWNGNLPHPCSYNLKGIKCNLHATNIVGIRLENMNLSGIIDAESLCKLRHLRVVSLAKNLIQGRIPNSISNCRRLTYLNLSSNLLSGAVPLALTKLKHLKTLDISNNHFAGTSPDNFKQEIKYFDKYVVETSSSEINRASTVEARGLEDTQPPSVHNMSEHGEKRHWFRNWMTIIPLAAGIGLVVLIAYCMGKKSAQIARDREILKALQDSPSKSPPRVMDIEEVRPEVRRSELVFFVNENEKFKLDDLLEATADLRSQTICSSLFMDPLISECGYSKFLDPKKTCLFSSNGYTAPEKTVSEQGDVFSFGVILLELLTGKTVEKTGIDLPKWVKAMVREEWTGEVFDKEVAKAGRQWAFPLLNVALKCVSNSPDDRPTMAEVLERIEEVVNGNDERDRDHSNSSFSSMESIPHDSCLLHTVIQENWDTPRSSY
ncbi:probable inactive receptor kinase At3g08680 [Citrus clementina]|uniref:probable inactive receptor kinase At3g08680 n=1 Tax=Citrus clementina TaxID=85681 RepID=UPI000CED5F0F|nr:probable inactive receptor kinase At3g08680 [Citrus x clementina]